MTPRPAPIFRRSLGDCLRQIHHSLAFRSALMDQPSLLGNPLPEDLLRAPLRDAIALFTALQIPYALVGGIAAMVYGRALHRGCGFCGGSRA